MSQNPVDKEDQENELMVLESILDKDQFIYSQGQSRHQDKLPSGQIQVDIDLPSGFSITVRTRGVNVNVNVHGEGSGSSSSSDGQGTGTRTEEVSFLPPITLLFTLPLNYPSGEAPLYTLQSTWLDRHTLSQLCNNLDQIWERNKGTVVLFSWIAFLKEETLKVAGCDNTNLDLGRSTKVKYSYHRQHSGSGTGVGDRDTVHNPHHQLLDQRAVFINSSIMRDKEILFNFLLEYNQEREEIEFRKGFHTCQVCFSDKVGTDFVRLSCGHSFCKLCMEGCYSTHIKDGTIDAVKCLGVKCSGVPSAAQVDQIVGKELFERYDQILLQRALEKMSDLVYCPRSKCGKPVIVDQHEKLACCSHCLYRFCPFCKMVYHGVEPCRLKNEERQRLFEEYHNASNEVRFLLEKKYGKKQLALLVQSALSEKYIERESKPCPHCKIPIEKSEGCNKMACTKCGAYFCWVCSSQLDKGNPYFHFQDPTSPCFNRLFEPRNGEFDEDDEDWEFEEDDDEDEDNSE